MKNIYIVLLTLVLGVSICSAQKSKEVLSRYDSNYFPHIEDSSGYQLYYAIEVYRKGKKKDRLIEHSREGSYVKFRWERTPIKGRWFFHNYPDTIVIKEIKGRDNLIIALNDISKFQVKSYDERTDVQENITGASLIVLSAVAGIVIISGGGWSEEVLLLKKKFNGFVHPRRETKYYKNLREKVESKMKEKAKH